jgi:hypothetical protein
MPWTKMSIQNNSLCEVKNFPLHSCAVVKPSPGYTYEAKQEALHRWPLGVPRSTVTEHLMYSLTSSGLSRDLLRFPAACLESSHLPNVVCTYLMHSVRVHYTLLLHTGNPLHMCPLPCCLLQQGEDDVLENVCGVTMKEKKSL